MINVDEAKRVAGVSVVTVAPDLLRAFSGLEESDTELAKRSMFSHDNFQSNEKLREKESFVYDEAKYKEELNISSSGQGARRTREVGEPCQFSSQ